MKMLKKLASILWIGCFLINCSNEISETKKEIFINHLIAVGNGDKNALHPIRPRNLKFNIFSGEEKVGSVEDSIGGVTQISQKLTFGDDLISKILINETTGKYITKDEERELSKREILILRLAASYSDFLGYYEAGKTFEVKGIDVINDQPCYKIEVQSILGDKISEIFVSKESYFLVKRKSTSGVEIYFEDYRLQNNIYVAHKVIVDAGSEVLTFQLESVTYPQAENKT